MNNVNLLVQQKKLKVCYCFFIPEMQKTRKCQNFLTLLSHSRHTRRATQKCTRNMGSSKFPRHPVATEKFKIWGRNNILLYYHYRVDQNLVKVFVWFLWFHVNIQPVFLNLINIGYNIFFHNLNQSMTMLKIDTKKNLNMTMIGSSWNY